MTEIMFRIHFAGDVIYTKQKVLLWLHTSVVSFSFFKSCWFLLLENHVAK